jgi:two-component system, cell cycle sensor histidine kinase and response regulator CckA
MRRDLKVLLVEDSPADAELVLLALGRSGYEPLWERVDSAGAMEAALDAGPWDVILSDFSMPGFGAVAALEKLQEHHLDVPFVVVSGTIGEESAVAMVRAGASDYVLKDNLARLGPAVARALAEGDLRRSRLAGDRATHRLATIVQQSADAILSLDLDGTITSWNPAAEKLYGWPAVEATGRHVSLVVAPEFHDQVPRRLAAVRRGEAIENFETVHVHRDGRRIDVAVLLSPLHNDGPLPVGCSTVARDITERKRLESQRQRDADSLARDALLLANVSDAVIVTDLEGVVTYWNEGASRLLGWTAAERLGKPHVERFPPAARAEIAAETRRLATGEDWNAVYEDYRKDGTRVWVDASVRRIHDRAGAAIGVMGISRDISARLRTEASLRLLDRAVGAVRSGILITDATQPGGPIVYVSPGFERLTGYTAQEALGRDLHFLHGPATDAAAIAEIALCLQEARSCSVELFDYRRDGTGFWTELAISPVTDSGGTLTHFVAVSTDVSDRRRLEEQYHQAQKMESIGQLAGGVAHDFNNLLTIINGLSELLLHELAPGDPSRGALVDIHDAGERGAVLTRQLLTFSRRGVIARRVIDLNAVLGHLERMLRRVLGEDVVLSVDLAPALGAIRADPGQIEQLLVNLAVNARDAMPEGGRLTIATAEVELAAADLPTAPPSSLGTYVCLTVSDTGCGMTPEVAARIFEPFFTTKGAVKGTGLGLAVVHGIVAEGGGHLTVDSRPGSGTTLRIFLPRVDEPLAPAAPPPDPSVVPCGSETVLLVEDEHVVRSLVRRVLVSQGYTVLEARSGEQALGLATGHEGPIDLLLTDVVMPGLSGRALAAELVIQRPQLRVLYVSGYTEDAVMLQGIRHEQVAFLQKPFGPATLARKVRETIDEPRPAA